MKTYVLFFRDHSGSMSGIQTAAMNDFNSCVRAVATASVQNSIETIVDVYEFGGSVSHVVKQRPIGESLIISRYRASGGTPLFQAMLDGMANAMSVPDYNDPEVTFVALITTDGVDTGSQQTMRRCADMVKQLTGTGRWTFAFRVPRSYKERLVGLGFEPGNILEWDQTNAGMAAASTQTDAAFSAMYTDRAAGTRSTTTFYSNMANVTPEQVQTVLADISSQVVLWPISPTEDGSQIRTFVESRLGGKPMKKGAAFYQLVKTEDKIQDYKLIALRNKNTGAIYCGVETRDMLGLPRTGDIRVRPADHGQFDVFVQSTSVNRKLSTGTQLLYWENVGIAFKEGVSAR